MLTETPRTLEDVLRLPSVAFAWRHLLPETPGLYFAVVDDREVAYVGLSTTSLRQRWTGHHRERILLALGSLRVAFLAVNDITSLPAMEREAIARFRPKVNTALLPKPAPIIPALQPRSVPQVGPVSAPDWSTEELDPDNFAIIRQAAGELGLSTNGVWKAIQRGTLFAGKFGRQWVIPRPELDRFKALPRKPGPKPRTA